MSLEQADKYLFLQSFLALTRRSLQTWTRCYCQGIFDAYSVVFVFVVRDSGLYNQDGLPDIAANNQGFYSAISDKRVFGLCDNLDHLYALRGAIGIYGYSDTQDGYKIADGGYGQVGTYGDNGDNFFFMIPPILMQSPEGGRILRK